MIDQNSDIPLFTPGVYIPVGLYHFFQGEDLVNYGLYNYKT